MEQLEEYLLSNFIDFEFVSEFTFVIKDVGIFTFIGPKDESLITQEFELNLSYEEELFETDFYCFEFGDQYYYTIKGEKLKLTPLRYIGRYVSELNLFLPFLGLHGGFELLNGSRDYRDWIKKAKFLNIDTLGICEKNTLAGTLKFQMSCKAAKFKSIIGEQVVVKDSDQFLQFKCFAKNQRGWENLLLINKEINVFNNGKFIEKDRFLTLLQDLVVISDVKYNSYERILSYIKNQCVYYQLDTVEFSNNEKDSEYLSNLLKFVNQQDIEPILISDAYYLDKEECRVKVILNNISGVRDYKSENQYFKSIEEQLEQLKSLFSDEDKCFSLFEKAFNNLLIVTNDCDFQIETKTKFLAEYILTDDEKSKYSDKLDMFWDLIQKGIDKKVIAKNKDYKKYVDRIEEEIGVIQQVTSEFGDGIDYFLILCDIIRYCKESNILTGIGRGSSSGSLISYLLDITKIDPFDYNLLFSRFLNLGRVKNGALPDVDTDLEALKRDDVKRYLESKYGVEHVCSVGTYTTLQLKAALKDISRQRNVDFKTVNYVCQLINRDAESWEDLFTSALERPQLKTFLIDHSDIIEDILLILKQPKSNSIHACATIVVPSNKSVFEYFPVRLSEKDGEQLIVSEWEGSELEEAGFLKEDILGIRQLDKYKFIINLIKKNHNIDIDIYDIPLDNKGVFDLFKKGNSGDIFHFGSQGLTKYCKDLQPEHIEDLIAGIALYRPGAMDINSHNEYILRKFGEREFEYKWGTESILSSTYGLIIYQESVMQIVQQLGDFDLVEADDVRRAVGKRKKDVIDKYKIQFLSKLVEKGCMQEEAGEIWHELEVHANYSFNKSHAAAYAITGYIGQWLKYNYPLQYWTSAFQFDDPNPKNSQISRFISEIRRTDNFIKVMTPHINESKDVFASNPDKMELYWSIIKVKQLGDKALEAILSEREKNGEFFDLEDFLNRVEKRVVNKAVVINLILSGSFDDLEQLKSASDRKILINKYYQFTGNKRDKEDIYLTNHEDYWWQIKQKGVSGFGIIDYQKVLKSNTKLKYKEFVEMSELQSMEADKTMIAVGLIKKFIVRTTKKDDKYCRITIDSNDEEIEIVLWSDIFNNINEEDVQVDKIIALNGKIIKDTYKGQNVIHSYPDTKIYFI